MLQLTYQNSSVTACS